MFFYLLFLNTLNLITLRAHFFFLSEIRSIIGHRNSSFHLLFHLFSVSSMNREFAGEGQQLHHLFTCKRLGFKNSFNP